MKKWDDYFENDNEASEVEFRGVAYTACALLATIVIGVGALFLF